MHHITLNIKDEQLAKQVSNPPIGFGVGDYRVLFDVVDETILVGRVLHRRESYR